MTVSLKPVLTPALGFRGFLSRAPPTLSFGPIALFIDANKGMWYHNKISGAESPAAAEAVALPHSTSSVERVSP